jgi:hypothetical protein
MTVTHNNRKIILTALDAIAIALSDHKHKWTTEQRRLYERAVSMLKKT